MVCDKAMESYDGSIASHAGLRILALHSRDPSSHQRLKVLLCSWLSRGLVDVAIGSGPHAAEAVGVVKTLRGSCLLTTSVGNFIHPTLSSQPNKVILQTIWSFEPFCQRLRLYQAKTSTVGCDGEVCGQSAILSYVVTAAGAALFG